MELKDIKITKKIPNCTLCNDLGYVLKENGNVICICKKQNLINTRYKEVGIPEYYWKYSLKDWDLTKYANGQILHEKHRKQKESIYKFCNMYIDNLEVLVEKKRITLITSANLQKKFSNIFLDGRESSGKTFLSAIIGMEAVKKGLSVQYYNFVDLLEDLNQFGNTTQHNLIAQQFEDTDLIIIDGLTREYPSQMKGNFLFAWDRLFSKRLLCGKPTIITSPASAPEVSKELGSKFKQFMTQTLCISLPSKIQK